MNAICKALCLEPGVEAKFGVTVAKMDWLQDRGLWSLIGLDGHVLGQFNGVVATDKNISSPRFTGISVKGFSFKDSEVLSWAFCDSSKPGRSSNPNTCERWVLHSTAEYAASMIARTGMQKPSSDTLAKVAEDLFQEFVASGLTIPRPFFMKAHRWGSAFPAVSIAGEEKCLLDEKKRLAICGDFCVSPNVEGAVLSGMRAASKFLRDPSSL